MANKKISELPIISGSQLASGDLFTLVDVSETGSNPSGANKAITYSQISGLFASSADVNAKAPINNPTFSGTVTIPSGQITRTNLRNGSGYSVIGRSASTSGVVADIIATEDRTFLRRAASSLAFSHVNLSTSDVVSVLPIGKGGTGVSSENTASTAFLKAIGVLTVDSAAAAQVVTLTGFNSLPALDGQYFDIYTVSSGGYRVWFNTGASSTPSSDGVTLIEIDFSTASKANIISSIGATGAFTATEPDSDSILITNNSTGPVTAPDSTNIPNLTLTLTTTGANEVLIVNSEITSRLS